MTEILPGLFLGRAKDSEQMLCVQLVINCTNNLPFHAKTACQVRIGVDDDGSKMQVAKMTSILADMVVFTQIQQALLRKETVLVHCRMGQQRSAAVVAGYLMYAQGLSPRAAMAFVSLRKHDAFLYRANFMCTLENLHQIINSLPLVTCTDFASETICSLDSRCSQCHTNKL